jgi:hypothetical protein
MDVKRLTGNPVNRGGDSVLVTSLKRVDNAENLSGVATSGSGVWEDCADGLLGVDDEDGADGESNALSVDVGGVLVVKHVVLESDLALLVANDGELEAGARDLVDVLDPATVAVDGVGRETNELDTTLGELGLELSEGTELGGADGGVVLGVREQNHPLISNELVEVDGTGGVSVSEAQHKVHDRLQSTYPLVVSASKFGATLPRRRGSGLWDILSVYVCVWRRIRKERVACKRTTEGDLEDSWKSRIINGGALTPQGPELAPFVCA